MTRNALTNAPLPYEYWMALAAAEAPIYKGNPGAHAYTDVNIRSESGGSIATQLWWDTAEQVEVTLDDFDGMELVEETARRVAAMLAIRAFGPEFYTEGR